VNLILPPRASLSTPATEEALASLHALLGPHAIHLLPLYRLTDGFESVIRSGELHLQLWSIADFTQSYREHQIIIGSDSETGDVIINTATDPAIVELWCAYGGGKIKTLSPLPDFLTWMLEIPS
jgi:hypothetical protein